MSFHAQSSHSSLYKAVEEASHRFSLILAEENSDNNNNDNNNNNKYKTIYQLDTIESGQTLKDPLATPRSSTSLDNETNNNNNTNKEERQQQQRNNNNNRPWSPSNFSLKPLIRNKFAGRNSMDNNNNNDHPFHYNIAKKKKSKSALGEFFSSFSSIKQQDTIKSSSSSSSSNNNHVKKIHYRLSSFPFEEQGDDRTSISNTTPSSSLTSLPPLLPPLSSIQLNNNNNNDHHHHQQNNNNNVSTSTTTTTNTSSPSTSSSSNHHFNLSNSNTKDQQKHVGQLLFGTNVNDPSFFKKEFHHSNDDIHQDNSQQDNIPQITINSLEFKKSNDNNNNNNNNIQNQSNGLNNNTHTHTNNNNTITTIHKDTFTLQQLIIDCHQIQQNIKMLNDNDEDEEKEKSRIIISDSDLNKCQHIIQQLEQFLSSSSISSLITSNTTTSNHFYHQSASGMQDQLKYIKNHIQSQSHEQIIQLKEWIYQCILILNSKNMVIPNQNYWIEGENQLNPMNNDYLLYQYHYQHQEKEEKDEDEEIDFHHHHHQQQYIKVDHFNERALWFQDYFCGKPYITFLGYENNHPLILNMIWDEEKDNYRCILRSTQEMDRSLMLSNSFTPYSNEWKSTIEDFFNIHLENFSELSPEDMYNSGIENDLIRLDKEQIHHRFKFGVLYIKQGQTKEEEWFSNSHSSESFDQFLDCLGERVPLIGYQGWAAGLDTKSGDSGEFIYVSNWQDNKIAYHVSTLIPTNPNDKQHIPRKRHIGNDIVCIVYVDGQQSFDPTAIKSQFLHVFIIVRPIEYQGKICWRVEITSVKNVPHFGPKLPPNQLFFDKISLHQFLIAKLINAEYAGLKAPKFTQLLNRARQGIITNTVERGMKLHHLKKYNHHQQHHHNKSLSSDGFLLPFTTTSLKPSSSTLLKEISGGIIVGLTRRRSTQDALNTNHNQNNNNHRQHHHHHSRFRLHSDLSSPTPTSTSTSPSTKSIHQRDVGGINTNEIRVSRSSNAILQRDIKLHI